MQRADVSSNLSPQDCLDSVILNGPQAKSTHPWDKGNTQWKKHRNSTKIWAEMAFCTCSSPSHGYGCTSFHSLVHDFFFFSVGVKCPKPVGALCSCCICWARAKPLCQVLKARVQVLFSRCPRAMKAVRCIALCSERIWNRHVDLCAISQSVRCPDYFYWSLFCHVVPCCVMLCQLALDVLSCMQGYCKEVKDVAEGGGFGVVQSCPVISSQSGHSHVQSLRHC